MATRRVFIAIDVGDEIRNAAAEYSGRLQKEFPRLKVRWERPEKFHITLRFEPKADERMMDELFESMKAAAATTCSFELLVLQTGAFVQRRGNAVLWLGFEEGTPAELAKLAAKLLPNEDRDRPFKPHLTIARTRDSGAVKELIERHKMSSFPRISHRVDELLLYESLLSPSGSTYEVIGSESLCG